MTGAFEELVAKTSLQDIGFSEVFARREVSPEARIAEVRAEPVFTFHAHPTETGFHIALRIDLTTNAGPVSVECYAIFHVADDAPEITQELLAEYANEEAISLLLPFVRQGIADVTQKVFDSPIIAPIFERGQLRFVPTA